MKFTLAFHTTFTVSATLLKKIFTPCLLALLIAGANAQQLRFLDVGNTEQGRYSVAITAENLRVGRSVIARVVFVATSLPLLSHVAPVLIACDGSWISTPLPVELGDGATAAEVLRTARRLSNSVSYDSIELLAINESELPYAKKLAIYAPLICKSAGKEPKNILLPIATTNLGNKLFNSMAIIIGTSSITNNTISFWIQSSEFRIEPLLKPDGNPVVFQGESMTKNVATGEYNKSHGVADCKARTYDTMHKVTYSAGGSVKDSFSISREDLRLKGVVPGSVGESILDTACKLYGQSIQR